MSSINIHILGAGRPFYGSKHNSLRSATPSKRVLDWQLQELSFLNANVYFVGGYQYEEVVKEYPSINLKINPIWNSSGPVASLFQSDLKSASKNLCCYGDILFKKGIVKKLTNSQYDISVAIDKSWRTRYRNRSNSNLNNSEKVKYINDDIIELSNDANIEESDAEFAGLVCLNNKVTDFIINNINTLESDFNRISLIELINYLIKKGFSIEGFDIENQWAELNNSNDLISFIFGTKADTLKDLSKLLTLSKIQDQFCFKVDDWNKNSDYLLKEIKRINLSDKLVVRSSSLSEDTFETANAGKFKSILNVDSQSTDELRNAINMVIKSYSDNHIDNQVLIQPMVLDTKISGVVFTHTLDRASPYYVINYDDQSGKTDSITSGTCTDSSTIIISRSSKNIDLNLIPDLMVNLLPAIQEIEELLDFTFLDIEFAITADKIVHLFQVRPITVKYQYTDFDDKEIFSILENTSKYFKELSPKNPFILGDHQIYGLMPDWNPAEIIGVKPSKLAFSLYSYLITDDIWSKQRAEYGYRDLRPNKLLISFAGQPYIDVRASINSFIPNSIDNSLAERLVNFYSRWLIDHPYLHDKLEFEVLPTCFCLGFEKWTDRLINKGDFSNSEIDKYATALKEITLNGIDRIQIDLDNIENIQERFSAIVGAECQEINKALFLLDDCKLLGTLPFAHLARGAFVAVTLLKSAVSQHIISQNALESFLGSVKTISHELSYELNQISSDNSSKAMTNFIKKYGHLRPGTYDINSLSYKEAKEKYFNLNLKKDIKHNKYNIDSWNREKSNFFNSLRDIGILRSDDVLEKFLYKSIEGREYSKFVFTKNLSYSLDYIVAFGKKVGLNRNQLSHLTLNSFKEYNIGILNNLNMEQVLLKLSKDNQIQKEIEDKIQLPSLICKENDFFVFKEPKSQPNFILN